MKSIVVSKDRFRSVLDAFSRDYEVLVPVKEEEYSAFKKLEEGVDPDFKFQNTRLSPKQLMQPQSEKMFAYTLEPEAEDSGIVSEIPGEVPERLVVGIRPCDALAVQLVKKNFETPEYRDPFWLQRYEKTLFVGFACNDPCATCFCTSVGCGPFHEAGLDVLMVDLGDRFLLKSLTDKGKGLVEKAGGEAAKDRDEKALNKAREEAEKKITCTVPTDKLADQRLNDLFDADFWEEVAFACINCGTCTFLCPTCWCFDIQDEVSRNNGIRLRNWDSCMFPLFTLHGSGHNPRDHKSQRVRQRFMHKLKYYIDKYGGGPACVGCGRCVQFCPVNIDIRRVFEKMNSWASPERKSA